LEHDNVNEKQHILYHFLTVCGICVFSLLKIISDHESMGGAQKYFSSNLIWVALLRFKQFSYFHMNVRTVPANRLLSVEYLGYSGHQCKGNE